MFSQAGSWLSLARLIVWGAPCLCPRAAPAAGELNGHEHGAGQSSSTRHAGRQTACPKTAPKLLEEEPSQETRCGTESREQMWN